MDRKLRILGTALDILGIEPMMGGVVHHAKWYKLWRTGWAITAPLRAMAERSGDLKISYKEDKFIVNLGRTLRPPT